MANWRARLVSWQCYVTLARVLGAFYMVGYWAGKLHERNRLFRERQNIKGDWPTRESTLASDRVWLVKCTCWIVFAVIQSLNDMFVLVVDRGRTDTYLGCILTQMVANFGFFGLTILQFVARLQWEASLGTFALYYPGDGAFAVFMLISEICSLFLLATVLRSFLALRSNMPIKQLCKLNNKDALDDVSPRDVLPALSVFGRPRKTRIPLPKPIAVATRFVTTWFLRRIEPVETRLYAFARNSFAIVTMGVLIFRTIAALLQAQNEFGTRIISKACEIDFLHDHNISILSDRLLYDSSGPNAALPNNVSIFVGRQWSDPPSYNPHKVTNCALEWSRSYRVGSSVYQIRKLELFGCGGSIHPLASRYSSVRLYENSPVYRVEVRPVAPDAESRVLNAQMPLIWLANMEDFRTDEGVNLSSVSEIREYLAPLRLLRDSHIITEPNLVIRKFITSSMMKDIILSMSSYRYLSLYPMSSGVSTALDTSGGSIATATIRSTLGSGLMYHQHQAAAWEDSLPWNICDYIEDYRLSTIFDVIGSVGGLFALLQAAHLLFFGRPLFWGIIGAKTISPFGLLGGYCSRGFKRRLREEYHSTSNEDGAATIQIVKFLRDFVIDFGPADLEPEEKSVRVETPLPTTPIGDDRDISGTHIPLMQRESTVQGPSPTE